MKKITYALLGLLFFVGAVFVFGITSPKETPQENIVTIPAASLEGTEPTVPTLPVETTLVEGPVLETEEPVETNDGSVVSFRDITYIRTSEGFTFKGRVYTTPDSNVEGMSVELVCEGVPITTMTAGATGLFEADGVCNINDEAYARVTHNGIVYESKHIELLRSVHRSSSIASTTAPTGVPEFSLMTLGIAVIVTTIGLVYLRKN